MLADCKNAVVKKFKNIFDSLGFFKAGFIEGFKLASRKGKVERVAECNGVNIDPVTAPVFVADVEAPTAVTLEEALLSSQEVSSKFGRYRKFGSHLVFVNNDFSHKPNVSKFSSLDEPVTAQRKMSGEGEK